ncbi:OLC1v1029153C1 [Oldenlandia corymbosa var. corymbosa]|uniref:OLC1v1029153C1 n=1 Tax=Oldenlandia corymbosa var. corymbosa TaxID=529605 RepID=A0AAV1CDQ5_OLDCO|nr:OLC1v1029153C1 [Oldenlandia corymbosa var. corymbosa]
MASASNSGLHSASASSQSLLPPKDEQIEALKAIGVDEVVLAINYQPEVMLNFLKDFETKLGIKITCSQETEPLGTAGPLPLAREKLIDGSGVSHFSFSTVMWRGLWRNKINAGIYLLNPSVLDRIELKPTSIEKEIFPKIAAAKKFYAIVLPGFWMDIGQPKDYITGLRLYLDSRKKSSSKLASGSHIIGNVIVDETAKIGEGCLIGPDVAIGPGCIVEAGVRLSRCTVMRGVRIKKHACISSCIIGWHSTVGQWACVENIDNFGRRRSCL